MAKDEDEREFSIVFRFTEDVLDFFFTEGESWVYFELRGFDVLGRVLRNPFALDTELEERAEVADLLRCCERR